MADDRVVVYPWVSDICRLRSPRMDRQGGRRRVGIRETQVQSTWCMSSRFLHHVSSYITRNKGIVVKPTHPDGLGHGWTLGAEA